MELKPGYKETEVGVIPQDWDVVQLGQVTDKVGSGITPTGGSRVYKDSGRPFIRSQNVGWGNLDLSDVAFIDDATHATFEATQIRGSDVFLNITGASIGRSAMADSRIEGGNVNQHVCIIRADQGKLAPDFLCSFLISSHGQRQIDSFQAGGNRQGLNFGQVRSIRIAIPETTDEQRAIATALSDADALLDGLDQLIAKKRDLKKAVMQQLLTGETRLPEFEGEWELKRLGDHVTFLRNGVNSRVELTLDDPVKYLHYGDIHSCTSVMLDPASLPSLPSGKAKNLDRLRDGDLVFADASEDLVGVSKSVEICGASSTEIVSGLHTIAARFDKNTLANGFKAYLQFCPVFSGLLRRLAAGTKVYATNRSHIASVEMRLPGVKEQEAIAAAFNDMDAEIAALEQRRNKTKEIKQAMMQELLTGKTRLMTPGGFDV